MSLTTQSLSLCHRLDSAILNPDLLPSVHIGDRILEINGIPVCNITPEEVGLKSLKCRYILPTLKATPKQLQHVTIISFSLDKSCDPGQNQTAAAYHRTQPTVSWWPPSLKQRPHRCQLCWPLCPWETCFNPQTTKSKGRATCRGRDRWTDQDGPLPASAPRIIGNAIQTHYVSTDSHLK